MSLSRYVLARNGVPLGARGALGNMLRRSLGAPSFAGFWRYWNPIWGYYLGRYVFRPANRVLPHSLAILLTFTVSGAIHDLAVTLVRGVPTVLFTPWFLLMSIGLLLGESMGMNLAGRSFAFRVTVNLAYLGLSLAIAQQVRI